MSHDEQRDTSGAGVPPASGIRLSDADRERFAELLASHTAAGRLSTDELEKRLEVLYQARTQQEAMALLADLPTLESSRQPRRRRRGYGERHAPEPAWVATNERFRDPSTQRIMRVWIDPATGARHYVPDESR